MIPVSAFGMCLNEGRMTEFGLGLQQYGSVDICMGELNDVGRESSLGKVHTRKHKSPIIQFPGRR